MNTTASARAVAITGIGELVTNDPELGEGRLGLLDDAAVIVSDDVIAWIGSQQRVPAADTQLDLSDRAVVPGFVDSHAHLVFAGDRSTEFAARMTGESYDGGGIAVTREATRQATDDDLRRLLADRVTEARAQGTTTVEIKSGYGLDVAGEARLLRLAAEVTAETTFLGAHVVPSEHSDDRQAYVDLVCGPMLAACAPYARWVDVFCEPHSPHAFTEDESRQVLAAGRAAGLGLRVHGNQLGPGPGVRLAVEFGAASVDHCTHLDTADIDALAGGSTVATLLPGVEFSTRSPYPDARRLLEAGVTVALATDCNPGTCASTSMPLMIALAVREMGLTPAEALWSATRGGAIALQRLDLGVVRVGGPAHLAVVDAPSYLHIPYRVGVPLTRTLELGDPVAPTCQC